MKRKYLISLIFFSIFTFSANTQAEELILKTVSNTENDDDYFSELYETNLYNYRIVRNLPQLFNENQWNNYMSLASELKKIDPDTELTEEQKEMLIQLSDNLSDMEQITAYDDVCWYIWGDSMPCIEDPGSLVFTNESFDNSDFRPYITPYLLENQETVKGNMIVVAGGGYSSRANKDEGWGAARRFNELGYNCFVLNRRVFPYAPQDSFIDMSRSIRFIQKKIEEKSLGGADFIIGTGFSGGSGTILGAIADYFGDVDYQSISSNYTPDEIDAYPSDLDAALCIYGPNYYSASEGEYSGIITDNDNLPWFFLAAGMKDYANANNDNIILAQSLQERTIVEYHAFANARHGFSTGMSINTSIYWTNMADLFLDQCRVEKEES